MLMSYDLSPMCISPPSSLILFIKQITLVSYYFFIELNMFLVVIKLPIICLYVLAQPIKC